MISKNLEQTKKIAKDFILKIFPKQDLATVVGLYGELGSGKTSFIQGVAEAFEIEDNVISPTFVIEKIYELNNQKFFHLIHIDAYRIEDSKEFLDLGWKEIISNSQNLILVEWPEKISDIMPEHIKVKFGTLEDSNSREIMVDYAK